MKILLCSVPFAPMVGGIETVAALLAHGFVTAGHELILCTQAASNQPDQAPYTVLRQPSARQLYRVVAWADVVLHNNLSLRLAWPLLLWRRPWVVAHHTWIPQHGAGAWAGRLKRAVLRAAHNGAVSPALAASLQRPHQQAVQVLPNPYDSAVFQALPEVKREHDLIFVGRLVSDKGVHLLLQALALLRAAGHRPQLTVVGQGPEAAALRNLAQRLGQQDQVHFAGPVQGPALARLLNSHRVLVVPSVWEEPFGLVVLEALACGCVPVVARSGGLPAALGRCGLVFEKNDAADLARCLALLLDEPTLLQGFLQYAPARLSQHAPALVAENYLQVLGDMRARRGRHANRTRHGSAAA